MQGFWDMLHGNPSTMLAAVVVPYVGRLEFIGWAYGKVRALFCGVAPAAKGLSMDALMGRYSPSWAASYERAGLHPCEAGFYAANKMVLWHWLQPAAYLTALWLYWGDISDASRWLGAIVAFREALYMLTTVLMAATVPGALLVSVTATLRDKQYGSRLVTSVMYVLAPEKFVAIVLGSVVGERVGALLVLGGILLDLAGVAAFIQGVLPEEPFPPALLVGYALTSVAGLFAVANIVDNVGNNGKGRKALTAMVDAWLAEAEVPTLEAKMETLEKRMDALEGKPTSKAKGMATELV